MDKRIQKPLWLYAVKGAATAGLTLFVKILLMLYTFLYYTLNPSISTREEFLLYIIIFIASLFVYNSVIGLFQTFDPPAMTEYFEGRDARKSRFARLFSYPSLLIEYGASIAVFSIAAAIGAFPEFSGMFYTGDGDIPFRAGLVPFAISLVFFTLFYMFRRLEAVMYWEELDKKNRTNDLGGNRTVAIRFTLILLFYPSILPWFPILLFFPSTILTLFSAISHELTVLTTVLLIVGILAGIYLGKLLAAILRRRNFIRHIQSSAKKCTYEISEVINPYRSLFKRSAPCRFDLKFKDVTYNCRIIGNRNRRVPICFSNDTTGYFRYRLGTPKHHITLSVHFDCAIEGDGLKILILDPTPKRAYLCEGEKEKVLFNADKVWGSVAYEKEAFIGTMERYCLGKADAYRM